MCAIAGLYAYQPSAPPADRAELRAIRDHMSARGPDGQGEWFSPDGRVALDRIRNKRERAGVAEHLAAAFAGERFAGQVHQVEHHLAHLSSAFHVSPFDSAVVVSVDGFGDFASAAWGVGRGTGIEVEDKVYFPHSLGIFYQALTQFILFSSVTP